MLQIMTIKMQIPDAVYASLLKGNTRVQGSIALISPREGNFNVHHRNTNRRDRAYRKLPHGRVSVNAESLRLTLEVALDETDIRPCQVLVDESELASRFVQCLAIADNPLTV